MASTAVTAAAVIVCSSCGATFASRNKLFLHLKEAGADHTKDDAEEPSGKRQCCDRGVAADAPPAPAADDGVRHLSGDEWYGVVVKPQGLATMGGLGVTLTSSDKMLLPDAIKLQISYKKLRPCHRLDLATGGVMLCSKSKLSERVIKRCFMLKLVRKRYCAMVSGKVEPESGLMDQPLHGKACATRYEVRCVTRSAQYGWVSTLDLFPLTGRNHQIRKHLQMKGHPILGDRRYATPAMWPSLDAPMFLWALEINFPHPKHCSHLVRGGAEDAEGEASEVAASGEVPGAAEDTEGGDEEEVGVVCIGAEEFSEAQRVTVQISEPDYYQAYRDQEEAAWRESSADYLVAGD
jgi:23S rRNA-/tRNA-specific pseudouridylate synthase